MFVEYIGIGYAILAVLFLLFLIAKGIVKLIFLIPALILKKRAATIPVPQSSPSSKTANSGKPSPGRNPAIEPAYRTSGKTKPADELVRKI